MQKQRWGPNTVCTGWDNGSSRGNAQDIDTLSACMPGQTESKITVCTALGPTANSARTSRRPQTHSANAWPRQNHSLHGCRPHGSSREGHAQDTDPLSARLARQKANSQFALLLAPRLILRRDRTGHRHIQCKAGQSESKFTVYTALGPTGSPARTSHRP